VGRTRSRWLPPSSPPGRVTSPAHLEQHQDGRPDPLGACLRFPPSGPGRKSPSSTMTEPAVPSTTTAAPSALVGPARRHAASVRAPGRGLYSVGRAMSSGSGSRGARIHTSCAVVAAPTFDRAFARWCFTVECDRPRRWAAALLRPGLKDRGDDADLAVCRAFGGAAGRPTRHALRTSSQGSGGSARRIVIGRSLVAGLSLSPRPHHPIGLCALQRGRAPFVSTLDQKLPES
jgi:hypothetical protein